MSGLDRLSPEEIEALRERLKHERKEPKYASFYLRMMASTIDTILSSLALMPIMSAYYKYFSNGGIEAQKLQMVTDLQENMLRTGQISADILYPLLKMSMPSMILQAVFFVAIIMLFWKARDATPGKMLYSMRIVDAETGESPTTTQYILRFFGYIVSTLPLCLGFIWIYFDKRKQGFHDKIAGTVVVRTK